MKALGVYFFVIVLVCLKLQGQAVSAPSVQPLLQVRRIYVDQLTGGPQADSLRELLIASLSSNGLFVLTDKEDRADATLKGAADDHTFEETFDSSSGISGRTGSPLNNSGTSSRSYANLGNSISDNESHHIKERKHEAFAAVRLCNKDGDVIWSTTQESLGGKFKGASADVAAKVTRQLSLDVERARRSPLSVPAAAR